MNSNNTNTELMPPKERLPLEEILFIATGVPEEVGGKYLAAHNYIFLRAHSSETARMAYDNLKTNLVRELRLQEGEDYLEIDFANPHKFPDESALLPDFTYFRWTNNLKKQLEERDKNGADTPYFLFLKNTGTISEEINERKCVSRFQKLDYFSSHLRDSNYMLVLAVGDTEYENGIGNCSYSLNHMQQINLDNNQNDN